jgi:hypothetical protein
MLNIEVTEEVLKTTIEAIDSDGFIFLIFKVYKSIKSFINYDF